MYCISYCAINQVSRQLQQQLDELQRTREDERKQLLQRLEDQRTTHGHEIKELRDHNAAVSSQFHSTIKYSHFLVFTDYRQEALLLQRYRATRFVTRNSKSDLLAQSRSLAFVPFDRLCMISY